MEQVSLLKFRSLAIDRNRVLLVEDEPTLARIVADFLELRGYEVSAANNGDEALALFVNRKPHICLLDVMLPGIDGYKLAQKIRAEDTRTPILFLTAKDQIKDVTAGFASGGNDYLKKPFNMQELLLRMENLLKLTGRGKGQSYLDRRLVIGKYFYDPISLELSTEGFRHKLSYRESEILNELYHNMNNVTLRKNLLLKVWGDDNFFNSRNLDVYIKKLRNHFKLDTNIEIITLKSVGYHFSVK